MEIDQRPTIESTYEQKVPMWDEQANAQTVKVLKHKIQTDAKVPKIAVMLVGLGGNNGSTFTAGILANKKRQSWETKRGTEHPNFHGSFTQCATTHVGYQFDEKTNQLKDVYKPVRELMPMVDPCDFEITGWDISSMNLFDACKRSHVLEPTLVNALQKDLEGIVPMPAVLNQEFIAANQSDRVDNVFAGTNQECIDKLRKDIQDAKARVDKVIILWTANTEMFLLPEIKDIADLQDRVARNVALPSSVLYAIAAIEEGILYLNGSPQNTFHPGVIAYAKEKGAFLGGSDFKSGQTRFKTMMSDYLIGSGIRLSSVVSYNHLGNNDGKNLQEDKCFQSKKISKAGVLDDAIAGNKILYPEHNKGIDHEVVIKYCPFVQDSKRALDEYSSTIFMNGINTINSYNICEDSLLATPLMIDMVILGELFSRMTVNDEKMGPVLSYLSFFFKAPSTNHNEYVINSFTRQRECLVNLLKVSAGIQPDDGTLLAFKF
jgi:myo-inositol-1-phosphate synthase